MGMLRLLLYQLQREQANKGLSLGQGEEVAVVGFGDVPDDALAQALAFAVLGGVVGIFGFEEQAPAVRPGLDGDAPPVRRRGRTALMALSRRLAKTLHSSPSERPVASGTSRDASRVMFSRRQRAALLARTALTTGLAQKWTVSVVVRLSERSRSWSARRS